MDIERKYECSDLYVGAYLFARGQPLLGVQRRGGKCFFEFADPPTCEALAQAFWSGSGKVTGLAFADAVKNLKAQIFANSDGRKEGN